MKHMNSLRHVQALLLLEERPNRMGDFVVTPRRAHLIREVREKWSRFTRQNCWDSQERIGVRRKNRESALGVGVSRDNGQNFLKQ